MSGRAKTAGGILRVPVMMDIQALTRQDFSGLTKEQKKMRLNSSSWLCKWSTPKARFRWARILRIFRKRKSRVST